MLKYLEDSESTTVGIRELEEKVLFPSESGSNVVRIARQAKKEKSQNLFQIFRQGEDEVLIASNSRWDAQLRGLVERGFVSPSGRMWKINVKGKKS